MNRIVHRASQEGLMHKLVNLLLVLCGLGLFVFSLAALYNSNLDSRLQLVVALGFAGLLLFAIGLRAFPSRSRRAY
jgi:Flp pilus assembly protein TadB